MYAKHDDIFDSEFANFSEYLNAERVEGAMLESVYIACIEAHGR